MVVSPPRHEPFAYRPMGLQACVPKNPNAHAPMRPLVFPLTKLQ